MLVDLIAFAGAVLLLAMVPGPMSALVLRQTFLSEFVPPLAPVLATILLLDVIQVVVDIAWYAALTWFVSRTAQLLVRPSVRRRLEQASGMVLIGFGLCLAVEHRQE